jgi:hypothetical protein
MLTPYRNFLTVTVNREKTIPMWIELQKFLFVATRLNHYDHFHIVNFELSYNNIDDIQYPPNE